MDTDNEGGGGGSKYIVAGHEVSALEFDKKLFYLYGYPSSLECTLERQEMDSSDAQGEELRRRYSVKLKLESELTKLGARITVNVEDSQLADFVVIPDDVMLHVEKFQHPGFVLPSCPVLSETLLLKNLQGANPANPDSDATSINALTKDSVESKDHAVLTNEQCLAKEAAAENIVAMAQPHSTGKRRHGSDTDIDIDSDGNGDYTSFDLDADEQRERTEWHRMLSAALTGDVVVSEKKRLNTQSDGYLLNLTDNEYAEHLSELLENNDYRAVFKHLHIDLWLGCRAVLRGRTPQQEKQTVESLRAVHADTALRAVIEFNADRVVSSTGTSDDQPPSAQNDFSAQCLLQAQKLLRRLDYVECMYPNLKTLSDAKPLYASKQFQERLAAITSWTNISVRLGVLYTMLQRWTGSQDLNLYSTSSPEKYESTTVGITDKPTNMPRTPGQSIGFAPSPGGTSASYSTSRQHSLSSASRKGFKHTPFVEQLLKENGLKKIFDQSILTELVTVMKSARKDMIANADMICEIGLPVTSRHMQMLLLFAPRLLQTCLQIRLEGAENLVNPAPAQVEQLIEDIKDSLAAACSVKRSFIELTVPTNKWNPGVELDPQYDHILLSCLQTYFRLLHRKMMNSSGSGITKVFEILENQWPFLLEISKDIEGGYMEVATRYCQQVRLHMHLWTIMLANILKGPQKYDVMHSRDLSKWVSRVLQLIRPPILKGQRLVRTIQNAVANSTDYTFDDPFSLLGQLVDTKHVLIYTSGEWESQGIYIIGSKGLVEDPKIVKTMLSAYIVSDNVRLQVDKVCYLLVVRTDAEFNWTGATIMPKPGEIQYQDLDLVPGQMRLISPGLDRLEIHRMWLEKINVADMLLPGEMATEATDEILDKYVRTGRGNNRNSTGSQSNKSSNNCNSTGNQSRKSSESYAGSSKRFSGSTTSGRSSMRDEKSGKPKGARVSSERTIDDELNNIGTTGSDFDALRPDLAPFERKLDMMNNPPGSAAARRALVSGSSDDASKRDSIKPPAPAHVRELTRAHTPEVHKEWTLLKQSIVRMLDALTQIPDMLRTLHIDVHERAFYEALTIRIASPGSSTARHTDVSALSHNSEQHGSPGSKHNSIDSLSQPAFDTMACRGANCDLVEQVQEAFAFVSNNAARGARFLDLKAERYVQLALMHMCVGWCGFITEDCMANEKRTFRWAVQALESTMRVCKDNTIQVLNREDWQLMKTQVAGCLTLMISHFDILGARNEELKIKELQKEREELKNSDVPSVLLSLNSISANIRTQLMQRQRVDHSQQVDLMRDEYLADDGRIGHVLEVTARPEDQTLRLLAASKSNITIRWQLGRYIGGGAFGAVYVGYNLDTGDLMAVKEIRFPARPLDRVAGIANANNTNHGPGDDVQGDQDNFGSKIVREMEIMSMMQHENIVTYYGIEVHREKVYLFMELCTKGSLAQLIKDQGRLDEETVQLYVTQMLRGLQYLHEAGICHRDIKSDNTLLDENMNIKLVDFGAARVLNQQSAAAATRKTRVVREGGKMSLAGTPMYMAPEVIAGSNGGAAGNVNGGSVAARHEFRPGAFGAQDIWSLGCCVVEMATGHPPWAHLDNEWAIMYHVVSGDPPLPSSSEVSNGCMQFIKRCLNRQPADRPGAAELLRDEWLADTIKSLERAVPQNQQPSRLTSEPSDCVPNLGLLPTGTVEQKQSDDVSHAHRANNPMDPMFGVIGKDDAHMHSYSSVGSVGSASNPANRSRASSISRKNLSGDLRFVPLDTNATNPETMLSLIDHRSIGGSYSSGDRSPSGIGTGFHGTLGGLRNPMSSIGMSPLARTPGSPGSITSLHGAWPYNKDTTGLGSSGTGANSSNSNSISISALASITPTQTAPPLVLSASTGSIAGPHAGTLVTGGVGMGSTAAAAAPSDSLRSAGLELAAMYSSPSAIYQAISGTSSNSVRINATDSSMPSSRLQHAMLMDSPVDSVTAASELNQFTTSSADASRPMSSSGGGSNADVLPNSYDNNSAPAKESFPLEDAGTDASASMLSNDEMQDLSETTRNVVTAMLSMPLEGVDVAGVAGWLGEGNTPMELLDAEEIKETVATTSHIVARQREQQIRRQQVMRNYMNRQKAQDDPSSKDKAASGAMLGASSNAGTSGGNGSQIAGKEQRIEPPSVFPLPPDDTEDEEYGYEYDREAEDEYESGSDAE
ncbi:Suppressor of Sensor Kinase (SLN1) [Coemansia sp. RSA 1813]|nr:Suppressor of Sensor Kinase (SLN1) [Coemansia sp. RSA 1646]KAJ1767133.1 Suppressor of Sensor Kinase (SLN1) [Coemansia sp. RSA 1843]KAJ2085967.1 Suppressor of Sensor Kinase (SLN1) [Coemansia sp. RSA 986]KAJ2210756.1 Suppressor of Sensor Kinase (SLN1) [Coemansia sp. RSA 487]KAJ2563588.1 Suppressor of Sensor Kinase (SLN1) [Coemansia sp. RSA 1813]